MVSDGLSYLLRGFLVRNRFRELIPTLCIIFTHRVLRVTLGNR